MYSGPDYLKQEHAQRMADRIKAYWHKKGHTEVDTWLVPQGQCSNTNVFGVRSNLFWGLPPQATEGLAA